MVQIPYEKPKKCRECIMYDSEHDFCKLSRAELDEKTYVAPDWCEIKELPKDQ